jgi:uncharacterized protein (UPF0261 family)
LATELRQTNRRKLLLLPYHINDPQFALAGVEEFSKIVDR